MSRHEIVADIDLVNAVQDAMKRRGLFSKLKAQVRAEVYNILEDKEVAMPEKPQDVFVASEIIKEFLSLLGLKNTLSVFCEEMGQPREMAVDRGVIGAELGLNTLGTEPSVPLLLMIVEHLKRTRLDYVAHEDASITAEANIASEDEEEIHNNMKEREYKLFLQEQNIKQKQEQLHQQQKELLEQQQHQLDSMMAQTRRQSTSSSLPRYNNNAKDINNLPHQGATIPDSVAQQSDAEGDTIFSLVNNNRYIQEEDNDRPVFDEDQESYYNDKFDD